MPTHPAPRRPTYLNSMRLTLSIALMLLAAGCDAAPRVPPTDAVTRGLDSVRVPVDSVNVLIVQRQVDAYNRRDLEAFLSVFAPDVRLYAFPDSLMYSGIDTLRFVYGRLFAEAPQLRATVSRRIAQGAYVLDQERTVGLPGLGPVTGVALYEVRAGRIVRVWFLE